MEERSQVASLESSRSQSSFASIPTKGKCCTVKGSSIGVNEEETPRSRPGNWLDPVSRGTWGARPVDLPGRMPLMDTDLEAMPRRIGRESVWVVAMTMLGAGVRLKDLGTLGLDHFDEGIYAQAATWSFADGGILAIDPGLIPYAPPGFPVLVGLFYRVIGLSGVMAILVSMLAGIATIPVLAWLSRACFGRGAGAATASIVALAGPHLVFSRMGLTDATFLLCWSLVMVAGVRFLERPGPGRAVGLGLLVGLAQLVKYNGWMAGFIVAIAVLVGLIRPGEERRSVAKSLSIGLVAVIVSAIVYLPWFLFVERTTGYGGLLAHHRSYVDGPGGWWPNWRQQMVQTDAMAGVMVSGLTWLGLSISLGWLGAAIGQGRSPRSWGRLRTIGPLAVFGVVLASLASPPNLTWWAALAWSSVLLYDDRPSARLVAVWFLVMAVSTPLYHPYARLWLPTLAAGWVMSGGLIAAVLSWFRSLARDEKGAEGRTPRRVLASPLAAMGAVVLATGSSFVFPGSVARFPDILARSDGIRLLAESLQPDPGNPRPTIHLFARPSLRYSLAERDAGPTIVYGDLEALRAASPRSGDRAVVDSAQGVSASEAERIGREGPWRLVERFDSPTAIATLLDVRPECVGDLDARHLGIEPDPNEARADREGWAGSARFWIYTAP